tara:strand:- start:3768 stop:4652 length:885 start_codon:yes stop_codon:yes gene_type:complete
MALLWYLAYLVEEFQGEEDQILEEYDSYLSLFPENPEVQFHLSHLIALGQYEGILDLEKPLSTVHSYAQFVLSTCQGDIDVVEGITDNGVRYHSAYREREKILRAAYQLHRSVEGSTSLFHSIQSYVDKAVERNMPQMKALSILQGFCGEAFTNRLFVPPERIDLGHGFRLIPLYPHLPPSTDGQRFYSLVRVTGSEPSEQFISFVVCPQEEALERAQQLAEQLVYNVSRQWEHDTNTSTEVTGDCESLYSNENPVRDRELKDSALIHLLRKDIDTFLASFDALANSIQAIRDI